MLTFECRVAALSTSVEINQHCVLRYVLASLYILVNVRAKALPRLVPASTCTSYRLPSPAIARSLAGIRSVRTYSIGSGHLSNMAARVQMPSTASTSINRNGECIIL
jgi:hypothetical protein